MFASLDQHQLPILRTEFTTAIVAPKPSKHRSNTKAVDGAEFEVIGRKIQNLTVDESKIHSIGAFWDLSGHDQDGVALVCIHEYCIFQLFQRPILRQLRLDVVDLIKIREDLP